MMSDILCRKFGKNEYGFADLPHKISLKKISRIKHKIRVVTYNKSNWKFNRNVQWRVV